MDFTQLGTGLQVASVAITSLMLLPLFPVSDRFGKIPWAWFCVFSILLLQLPEVFYAEAFHTDEMQMIVQSRMLMDGRLPWVGMDPTTSGPLNSLWPWLGGMTVTGVRSVSLLAQGLSILLIFLGLKKMVSEKVAWSLALIPWGMLALHRIIPLKVFHSLVVPILLFSLAFYLWSKFCETGKRFFLTLALVTMGCQVLAKLQVAPAAYVCGLVLLLQVYGKDRNRKNLASHVLTLAAPGILLVLFVAVTGGFRNFVQSYLLMAMEYGAHYINPQIPRGARGISFISWRLLSPWVELLIAGFMASIFALFVSAKEDKKKFLPFTLQTFALLASMAIPGIFLMHYLFVLLAPLFISMGLLLGKFLEKNRKVFTLFSYLLSAAALFYTVYDSESYAQRLTKTRFEISAANERIQKTFEQLDVKSQGLVVWGWEPKYYLLADTLPGVQDSISQYAMIEGPSQSYYVSRMIEDMKKSHPRFFLDAVCAYHYLTGDCELQKYPELNTYVTETFFMKTTLKDNRGIELKLWERISP